MTTNFKIMDVTCRDGSYVSNFQMSLSEEKSICSGLDKLGVPFIEVGHGMGIGASNHHRTQALHTDREYLECARNNIKNSSYGVFCIPGIASIDDLKVASEYGCSFVRIGSNVEDIDKTEPFIKAAKELGLTVMSNYMKSYASSIDEFKEAVKKSEAWGSKYIYIVDSAGGMIPDEVEKYYNAIRDISNIKTGFHGHNNIGLALTNSITAAKIGVDIIDCSLQGLGRSAGNTSLEEFVICMQKFGSDLSIDEIDMLLLSKKHVFPMVKNRGINPIDVECGISGFHSSYLQSIRRIASKHEVNPLLLIREYCKHDKVNMDESLLESIASSLANDNESLTLLDFDNYFGNEQQ